MVFGVMGGLVAAYVLWLVVRGPPLPQSGWVNGWGEDVFFLTAGVVCVIGGLRWRPGSFVPLVFGLALIFTAIGNTILTVDALHGIPPPPPTPADFFGLGFIVLCFVGIGLMAREDRERLSPRELLDGGIAALGAAAVCAAFVLVHLPHRPGQSTFGTATQLAYPIGYVVLVLIVVGAATVASKRSRAPWVTLMAAFALLAVGSALAAAAGPSRLEAIKIVTLGGMAGGDAADRRVDVGPPGRARPAGGAQGNSGLDPRADVRCGDRGAVRGDAHAGRPCGHRAGDGGADPGHAAGL